MRTDLVFEANYGYWFNLANERLWRRIDFALNFAQLVGGSATVISFISNMPRIGIAIGLSLSIVGALSLLLQAGVKAQQHDQAKCRFLELRRPAPDMGDDELQRRVLDAQRALAGVRSLANPAYNTTLEAMGLGGGQVKLNWPERVANFAS
jgi:hypothetical protein